MKTEIALPFAACALVTALVQADVVPWGASTVHTFDPGDVSSVPVVTPAGDTYVAGGSLVRKFDAAGRQVFSVALGDADIQPVSLGSDGNVYLAGYGSTIPTTPGAYIKSSIAQGPFACKLSGVDGRVLFCTYIDRVGALMAVAGDGAGAAYVVGFQGIEKFDDKGKLIYRTALQSFFVKVTADAFGNAFIASNEEGRFLIAKLDATGRIVNSVHGGPGEYAAALAVDSAGSPQVLIGISAGAEIRKFSPELILQFDTTLGVLSPFSMAVDPNGITIAAGVTNVADLREIRPTGTCDLPGLPDEFQPPYGHAQPQAVMVRLDPSGQLIQQTYVALGRIDIPAVGAGRDSAAIAALNDGFQLVVATLSPSPEVQLGCVADAASLRPNAVSPEEIVSLFGQHLGPDQPVSAQPGADGRYPTRVAGTEVTFDGFSVPLLYVSGNQINAVTPRSLSGKVTTEICVVVSGATTNCVAAPVKPATPAVFRNWAATASYSFPIAAAVNEDGTINSRENPAPGGSIVSIFATGLGTIAPAVPDGALVQAPLPAHELSVTVRSIGAVEKNCNCYLFAYPNVTYAGSAPGEVKGVTQINVEIPETSSFGLPVLIDVSSGAFKATTPVFATIWTKPPG